MAKQNPRSKASSNVNPIADAKPPVSTTSLVQLPSWSAYVLIFLFTCMLYSNTLWNKYAIDDTIVLTDNKFTKKGFAGIKDHFTHDMFEGFFGERGAKLVSGGRYRPLSAVTLTLEYETMRKMRGDKRTEITDKNMIMGDNDPYLNPMLSHGINILLFALTGLVLYYLLIKMIPAKKGSPFYISLPFIITMLYVAHPIHTEAVANIKGRDEVVCMLFSLLALVGAVMYVRTKNVAHIAWASGVYFIAMMSKENAITFLAVVPLTYFFFTQAKLKEYLIAIAAFVIPVAIFLGIRHLYTQAGLKDDSPEILNNPFVGDFGTFGYRYGTTIYTFLRYYILMLIPHPLTHDYYYNQVPYYAFDSIWVWLSIFLTTAAGVYAVFSAVGKKSIAAYGILFFFITFSVASNLIFTVGILMNERFVYMSSLGFCMLLAYLLVKSMHKLKLSPNYVLIPLITILCLYSYKTFSRNFDWKDSFTLFRRDVIHSPNSAKIQTSVGGDLTKASDGNIQLMRDSGVIKTIFNDLSGDTKTHDELIAINMQPDSVIRHMLLDSSISHLNEAIRIYPNHSNAWLLMGNAMYKRDHKPQEVIPVYEKASQTRVGGYYDADFNLGIVYNENNQPEKAKVHLLKACEEKADQVECRYLLAQVYAKLNQPDSVEYWIRQGQLLKPASAADYYTIGTNFGKVAHNLPLAIQYLSKAIEMNPKAELYMEDLGVAYGIAGRFDDAIAVAQRLIEVNPKYPAAYMNLSISYRNKGNKAMADQYQKKYEEVIAASRGGAATSSNTQSNGRVDSAATSRK